jgi:cobyrinic acid a,c-diamide synthase
VAVFKKGPDYIDAGWLGLAAGSPCYNLDTYLFDATVVRSSFAQRSLGKDISVVEGNRGIFDGVDSAGSYSTAELAKLLRSPSILIVDATKVTRTAAALVLGCRSLDPHVNLAGVILNRVAGLRHEQVLRTSIEQAAGVPVIGSVRKLAWKRFPQRHLGLLPSYEHPGALEFLDQAAEVVEQSIDLERTVSIANQAQRLEPVSARPLLRLSPKRFRSRVRIGIVRDSAFQFYYPENLEALVAGGAQLVEVSALASVELPELDALYIGGGFPETHAERLAANSVFRRSLRNAVEAGLPVYAECGGLMYLSRNLCMNEHVYPMVGVFPMDTVMEKRPQGLGYIRVEVAGPNPFYPQGAVITGHEFHYSSFHCAEASDASFAFRVLRGHGIDGQRDGICYRNALGTYVHVHALGEPLWAEAMVRKALEFGSLRREAVLNA